MAKKMKYGKDESKMMSSTTLDQDRKYGKKKGKRKRTSNK
jgi:hypothetical protein